MLKPTKILVPTDFSEYSDKALKQALDIAKQYNAKVYVIHVIPVMLGYTVDYAVSADSVAEAAQQARDVSVESMKNQLAKYPEHRELEVETSIVEGMPPAELVLQAAEEQGSDLIVIASLGRSGISKYLIGSVARNILKGAKCPVLLTK